MMFIQRQRHTNSPCPTAGKKGERMMKKGNGNSLGRNYHGFSLEWLGFLIDFQGLPVVRERLSSMTGIPVSQLDTLIHKIVGISYKELAVRIKLLRSLSIVPHANFPLGEVARCCGFPTADSYYRSFKKVFGFHPDRLREKISKRRMPEVFA